MAMRIVNRSQQVYVDQSLIDGLKKRESELASIIIDGTSHMAADLIAILEARIAAASKAITTRATWLAAVQTDEDERARAKRAVSGLKQVLQIAYGGSLDALADFGVAPRKPRPITPETAVAKAKATRAARQTMGKKQKQKITGATAQSATENPTPVVEIPR
jgi:hypothetical protein